MCNKCISDWERLKREPESGRSAPQAHEPALLVLGLVFFGTLSDVILSVLQHPIDLLGQFVRDCSDRLGRGDAATDASSERPESGWGAQQTGRGQSQYGGDAVGYRSGL